MLGRRLLRVRMMTAVTATATTTTTAATPAMIHGQGEPGESFPVASIRVLSLSSVHVTEFPSVTPLSFALVTLPGKVTVTVATRTSPDTIVEKSNWPPEWVIVMLNCETSSRGTPVFDTLHAGFPSFSICSTSVG